MLVSTLLEVISYRVFEPMTVMILFGLFAGVVFFRIFLEFMNYYIYIDNYLLWFVKFMVKSVLL